MKARLKLRFFDLHANLHGIPNIIFWLLFIFTFLVTAANLYEGIDTYFATPAELAKYPFATEHGDKYRSAEVYTATCCITGYIGLQNLIISFWFYMKRAKLNFLIAAIVLLGLPLFLLVALGGEPYIQ